MSEKINCNLKISRNHVEISHISNPSIILRKVGFDYLVVTQNNQNICIYRNQIHHLIEALMEISSMPEEEVPSANVKTSTSPFEPNRLDLLVAGKLEEYDSNPNLEFEPKTLTEEVVNSQSPEPNQEQELDSYKVPRDEVKTISIPDTSDSDINNLSASNGEENISNSILEDTPNIENEDNSISNNDLNNIEENTSESVSEKKGILDKILGKTKKPKK